MRPTTLRQQTAAILCGLLAVTSAFAVDPVPPAVTATNQPPINPEVDRLFRAVCARLASAKAFSYKVEIWDDEVIDGHKVSRTKLVDVRVRRPDRLQMEVHSQPANLGWWYDGKSLTLLYRRVNLYGTAAMPDTIDKFLDAANEQYGIAFPLEDLLMNDPYTSAKKVINGGAYLGKTTVLGTPCQHIGFSTDAVDTQFWIEDGPTPLIRKFVITYKLEDTAPQRTTIFSDWKLNEHFSDKAFEFIPPKGAAKIEMSKAPTDE
jgi:hypothetical protein